MREIIVGILGIVIGVAVLIHTGILFSLIFIIGGLCLLMKALLKRGKKPAGMKKDSKPAGVQTGKANTDHAAPTVTQLLDSEETETKPIAEADAIPETPPMLSSEEKEESERFSAWVFEPDDHREDIFVGSTFYLCFRSQTVVRGSMWMDMIAVAVERDGYMVRYRFFNGVVSEDKSIVLPRSFFEQYNDTYTRICGVLNGLSESGRIQFTEEMLMKDAVVRDWVDFGNERLGVFEPKDTEPSNVFGFSVTEAEAKRALALRFDDSIRIRRDVGARSSWAILDYHQIIQLVPAVKSVLAVLHRYLAQVRIDHITFYEDNHDMYESFFEVSYTEAEFQKAVRNHNSKVYRTPGLGYRDGGKSELLSDLRTSFCKATIFFSTDQFEGTIDINCFAIDIYCKFSKTAPKVEMFSGADIGAKLLFDGIIRSQSSD